MKHHETLRVEIGKVIRVSIVGKTQVLINTSVCFNETKHTATTAWMTNHLDGACNPTRFPNPSILEHQHSLSLSPCIYIYILCLYIYICWVYQYIQFSVTVDDGYYKGLSLKIVILVYQLQGSLCPAFSGTKPMGQTQYLRFDVPHVHASRFCSCPSLAQQRRCLR